MLSKFLNKLNYFFKIVMILNKFKKSQLNFPYKLKLSKLIL